MVECQLPKLDVAGSNPVARFLPTKEHSEKREAVEEAFNEEIHGAINYLSSLAFQVIDGVYDEEYETEVKVLIRQNVENGEYSGQTLVKPVKGFKKK